MLLRILLLILLLINYNYSLDFYEQFESSSNSPSTDLRDSISSSSINESAISSESSASTSVGTQLTPGDFGSIAWNKFNNFMEQEVPGRGLEPILLASNLKTETLQNLTELIQNLEKKTRNRKLKSNHPDNFRYNHHRNLEHAARNLKKYDSKVWQLNLRDIIKLRTDGLMDAQNNVSDVWFTKHFLEVWQKFQSEATDTSSKSITNIVWQRSTDYVAQALPTTNGLPKDTRPRTAIADISEWCQMWDVVRRGELSFPFHSVAKRNFIQFQGNIKSAFKYGVAIPTYLGLIKPDLDNLLFLRMSLDDSSVQESLRTIRNISESELSSALVESFKNQTLGVDLFELASKDLLSDQLSYVYQIWENTAYSVDYQTLSKSLINELIQSDLAQSLNEIKDQNKQRTLGEFKTRLKSAQRGLVASEKVYNKAVQDGLNQSYFEFRDGRVALKSGVLGSDVSNPKVIADFNNQFNILSEAIRKHRVTGEDQIEDLSVLDKKQGNNSYRKQYFQMLENLDNIDYEVLDTPVTGVVYDAPNGLFVRQRGFEGGTVTNVKIGKLINGTQVTVTQLFIDKITGKAIFYAIDADSEVVKTQLYTRFRENAESNRSFLAADYVKLNENIDFRAIKSQKNLQRLSQHKNEQLKTRLSKIITDLEGSLKSFEELNFDARKENQFVKYQANGWNPFGKQKQSVTFIPSARGMILAHDLRQLLLNIQDKDGMQISNEEDALISIENLFETDSLQKGFIVTCAWRYSVCVESVTQRLKSLQNGIKLITID